MFKSQIISVLPHILFFKVKFWITLKLFWLISLFSLRTFLWTFKYFVIVFSSQFFYFLSNEPLFSFCWSFGSWTSKFLFHNYFVRRFLRNREILWISWILRIHSSSLPARKFFLQHKCYFWQFFNLRKHLLICLLPFFDWWLKLSFLLSYFDSKLLVFILKVFYSLILALNVIPNLINTTFSVSLELIKWFRLVFWGQLLAHLLSDRVKPILIRISFNSET